ncbi:sulfite exporter TauE/SafE family protein [Roseobacter sp. YSTF-M11]|uniref:Probable membrane transporter protein n=1 Tax=Roseobacter insulae TaxID=2859783 RepID=A0A9X1FW70_9RHOB|nr:sulfite exporter TauE/SafE family protein [Roseobacter insulae]MBW4708484.1 sulfite exporter TauE/SafE family protein [Roseobacter insulae]
MLEALSGVVDTGGLIWLTLGVVAAGLVRGFAGFGSGMIIMPVASAVLPPVAAVTFMMMAELVGPLPNLPAAWRDGAPRDVGRLMIGCALAVPVGILCLSHMDTTVFGWVVSTSVAILLVLLMSGWRYKGVLTPKLTVGTGALGGFMGGFAGVPGPPVIMLYMSSKLPISVIRANFLLYLLAFDVVMVAVFFMLDLFVWKIALLGLLAGVPNLLANMVGARLFDPDAEVLFRRVAYLVIAASAILGLPIWS